MATRPREAFHRVFFAALTQGGHPGATAKVSSAASDGCEGGTGGSGGAEGCLRGERHPAGPERQGQGLCERGERKRGWGTGQRAEVLRSSGAVA